MTNTSKVKIVNPEKNDTERTFPRSLEEVMETNPLFRELNATESIPWEGPFDEHGIIHKRSYAWFWLTLWFLACTFGTMLFIAEMEKIEYKKQIDECLDKRGPGALPVIEDGIVIDCIRRR